MSAIILVEKSEVKTNILCTSREAESEESQNQRRRAFSKN